MSEAYHDNGILPFPGYVSGSTSFQPIFIVSPTGTGNASNARTIWVSNGGLDTNTGSVIAPLATIQAAINQRQTLSNANLVTIAVLSGTYTPTGGAFAAINIPDNTAIVGVPCGQTNSPVIYNGIFSTGTGVVVGSKIIISGLAINGEVKNAVSVPRASITINQCIITSPGAPQGQATGAAIYSVNGGDYVIEGSSIYSNITGPSKAVIYLQGGSLKLISCTIKNTQTIQPGFPVSDVIFTEYSGSSNSIIIDNCNISTDYNLSSNSPRLCHFKVPTSSITSISITNSNLTYPSNQADGNKVCIFFDGTNATTAAINSVISNCLLYCPGTTNAVVNGATILNNMYQGGNLCAPGANTSVNLGNAVTLVALIT
jgi:hypothetical protein